jgi:hypothetical protein
MIRVYLVWGCVFLLAGCNQGANVGAQAGAGQNQPADAVPGGKAQTALVQSLMAALDEDQGATPEAKKALKESLLKADARLKESLSQRPKRPPTKTAPATAAKPQEGQPAGPQQPKTPILRVLVGLIDEAKEVDQKAKDDLKNSLLESDAQLSQILGGNSKRLIMEANKKAPAPVIGQGRPLPAKVQRFPKKSSEPPEAPEPKPER